MSAARFAEVVRREVVANARRPMYYVLVAIIIYLSWLYAQGDVCDRGQLRVVERVPIDRVEPGEPEIRGQPSEMHVKDEPQLTKRLRPDSGDLRDVDRLENRVNADPVSVLHPMGEVDRHRRRRRGCGSRRPRRGRRRRRWR